MVTPSGARAIARCDQLGVAPYSDLPDQLFRAYLTPAFAETQRAIAGWMADAGMDVSRDAAANLIGRYDGTDTAAPALLIGSHIDSVRDAGRYDGPLGVLLGIECVAALQAEGRRLPFPIHVIAFGDEEGSRFPASMLTSRAVAGTLDPAALAIADPQGITLDAALRAFDPVLGTEAFATAACPPGSVFAYLETHIEQGPFLESEGLPVGSVTGIAAQHRYAVHVTGRAGHAGTCSMELRHDALTAAAAMVLAVERIARAGPPDLVATVGTLRVAPGAVNVVPGAVDFTLDIRAGTDALRDEAAAAIAAALTDIAATRGAGLDIARTQSLAASPCAPDLVARLDAAIADQGLPVRRLVSGAGHDAMVMAALCPTAMLFVRCTGGISHNPAENATAADADVALAVMRGFIDRLATG